MAINTFNMLGIIMVLILIIGVGVYSGKKVKNASDFSTGGGKTGAWIVSGSIMGALVSGQATMGTAQLAFNYGMSAWWFTLGSGIGCLLLAFKYVIPLRNSGCDTVIGVVAKEYGEKAGYLSSILSSIGIFISVLVQVIACMGLITTIFPVSNLVAAFISIAFMAVYVVFGGTWGAGMGGFVKFLLLYASCIVGLLVILSTTGVGELWKELHSLLAGTSLGKISGIETVSDVNHRFGSLVSHGVAQDIGSGISVMLGVISTQTYVQAVWSGKSDRTAKRGALLSAFLIPPIGIVGILIGLYMRVNYITQAEYDAMAALGEKIPDGMHIISSTIQVFPVFVIDHMPIFFAGIVLGTLLISIVGGGAGLTFGVATILIRDILKKISSKVGTLELKLTRITIVLVLLLTAAVGIAVPSATVNDLGYLSMGLRAAVVFVPMTCALYLKGKINSKAVLVSVVMGPVGVVAGQLLKVIFNPLFIGIALSILIFLFGFIIERKIHHEKGEKNLWKQL